MNERDCSLDSSEVPVGIQERAGARLFPTAARLQFTTTDIANSNSDIRPFGSHAIRAEIATRNAAMRSWSMADWSDACPNRQ
jgi:hypothetical protein